MKIFCYDQSQKITWKLPYKHLKNILHSIVLLVIWKKSIIWKSLIKSDHFAGIWVRSCHYLIVHLHECVFAKTCLYVKEKKNQTQAAWKFSCKTVRNRRRRRRRKKMSANRVYAECAYTCRRYKCRTLLAVSFSYQQNASNDWKFEMV